MKGVDLLVLAVGVGVVLHSFASEGALHVTSVAVVPLSLRSLRNGHYPSPSELPFAPLLHNASLLSPCLDNGLISLVWSAAALSLLPSSPCVRPPLSAPLAAVAAHARHGIAVLARDGELAVWPALAAAVPPLWRGRLSEGSLVEAALAWWPEGVRRGDAATLIVAGREGDEDAPNHGLVELLRRKERRSEADIALEIEREARAKRVKVAAWAHPSGVLRWDSSTARQTDYGAQLAAQAGLDLATFRLHALRDAQAHEATDAHWTAFAGDVEAALPHEWNSPFDTRVKTASWRKASSVNAVVVHHAHGLTAYHAYSGRALTRVLLEQGLHADVDGDGLIEHCTLALPFAYDPVSGSVSVHSSGDAQRCEAPVRVGLPPIHAATAVAVCTGVPEHERPQLSAVGPILVSLPVARSTNATRRVLVYLLSTGRLQVFGASAVGRASAPTASVVTPASWFPRGPTPARRVALVAYSGTRVLAVGDGHAALVDVAGAGRLLASWPLDEPLVRPPAVVDVDGDGHLDVVCTTRTAVHVFRVRPGGVSRFYGVVVLCGICVLTGLVWSLSRKGGWW